MTGTTFGWGGIASCNGASVTGQANLGSPTGNESSTFTFEEESTSNPGQQLWPTLSITYTTAMSLYNGGSWNSVSVGLASGFNSTGALLSLGIQGKTQNSALSSDEVVCGTSISWLGNGTVLWAPPLQVVANGSPLTGYAPLKVSLATNVSGGTGTYSWYNWTFGDGSVGTGATTTHTYNSAGTFLVTVAVTDSGGEQKTSLAIAITVAGGGLTTVMVSPSSAALNPGSTQTFTPILNCNGGGCPPGVTYAWTLTNAAHGSLNSSAGHPVVFTASTTLGNVTLFLNATLNGATRQSPAVPITITSSSLPNITSVAVLPPSTEVPTGGIQAFSTAISCTSGAPCPAGTTYSWTLTKGIGSLNSTSGSLIQFTARAPGTTTLFVNASLNGKTVQSPPTSITIGLPLWVHSMYGGGFLTNFTLNNEFGVNSPSGTTFGAVTGNICGHSVSFSQGSQPGLWSTLFNVGQCSPGQAITVVATTTGGGTTYIGTLPLSMYWTPTWLSNAFSIAGILTVNSTAVPDQWNQSYTVSPVVALNFSRVFGNSTYIPLLDQFSGDFLPTPDLNATFSSGPTPGQNTLKLSAFYATSTTIPIDGTNALIGASVSAVGRFTLPNTGSIQWDSAWLNFTAYGVDTITVPIWGDSFQLAGYNITLGLTFSITINPSFALNLLMTPSSNPANDIINGLAVQVSNVSGDVSLALTPEVNFGLWGLFQVTAGAHLRFTDWFASPPLRTVATNVAGTLFAQFSALFGLVTWTWTSNFYNQTTGVVPSISSLVSALRTSSVTLNRSVLPRYYDVGGYDSRVWVDGGSNGTVVQDIFPETKVASVGVGSTASLLYTTDNVSMPSTSGIQLEALGLNTSTDSLSGLPAPPTVGEIAFAPQMTALSDGEELGVWEAVPSSDVSYGDTNVISGTVLQGSLYNPTTRTWGQVQSLGSVGGYIQGVDASSCGNDPHVATLVTDSLAATGGTGSIVEYDFTSGSVLNNVSTNGFGTLVNFDCKTNQAVLENNSGVNVLFNITTGLPVNALQGVYQGQTIAENFVSGSGDMVAAMYSRAGSTQLILYNPESGVEYGPFAVTGNFTSLQGDEINGTFYVTLGSATEIQVWSISSPTARLILHDSQETNITQYGMATTASGLVVWALNNHGNQTYPLLDLTTSIIPVKLSVPSPPHTSRTSGPAPGGLLGSVYVDIAIGATAVLAAVAFVWFYRRRKPHPVTKPTDKVAGNTPAREPTRAGTGRAPPPTAGK